MKFLKFLLITVIALLVLFIGMVVFSNKILTELTKSKDSEFENLKFSISISLYLNNLIRYLKFKSRIICNPHPLMHPFTPHPLINFLTCSKMIGCL
mgnify:CR=1 FL=1